MNRNSICLCVHADRVELKFNSVTWILSPEFLVLKLHQENSR